MKISIIGCGFIAEIHAEVIQSLGHELAVVVSRNKKKAAKFAKKWHIPNYGTNFNLAIENSDCIHICTPPLAHFDYAKKAILAKKHLICEKPLTIDPKEAKTLYDLANKNQTIAAVVFNVRYHEACQRAKNFISQNDFGDIRLIHGAYLQEFHAVSDFYSWRYQEEIGGKMRATTEIGSHWIDLVRYWTDLEITAVSANFSSFDKQRFVTIDGLIHREKVKNSEQVTVNSEDVATIFFKFSNGAIGNVVLSEISHGKTNQLKLEITGKNQSIWWNNEQPYQLFYGKKNEEVKMDNQPFGGGFSDTFKQLFKDVYQAIEKPSLNPTYPTFKDGYINAVVCDAIFKSAKNDSVWVKV